MLGSCRSLLQYLSRTIGEGEGEGGGDTIQWQAISGRRNGQNFFPLFPAAAAASEREVDPYLVFTILLLHRQVSRAARFYFVIQLFDAE